MVLDTEEDMALMSKWKIRRRCFYLKVQINPSGVVRGRIQCRTRWVNLVCLIILPRRGIHRVVEMAEDKHQQPTGVDVLMDNAQI